MRGGWVLAFVVAGWVSCAIAAPAVSGVEAEAVASLPRYEPREPVAGVIRIWGHGHIKLPWMKPLVMAWEKGFQRYHPGISIDYQMHGTSSGIPALFTGMGDIAILGEEIDPVAVRTFERCSSVIGKRSRYAASLSLKALRFSAFISDMQNMLRW